MDHLERLQITNASRLLNNLLMPRVARGKAAQDKDSSLFVAKAIRANMVEREKALPFLPSCSPGWRILLEIFISEGERRPICVSDIGHSADIAGATTLRWLKMLEGHGLVAREADVSDRRRCWLHLTGEGKASVALVMEDLAARVTPAVDFTHFV